MTETSHINGLAESAKPEKARIKAGSRADIKAVQDELAAWVAQQRNADVIAAAQLVWFHLRAAQIGTWQTPGIKRLLIADVANLERARADGGAAQGR